MVEIDMLDLALMAVAFEKVAANKGRFTVAKTRKGRRPMSVEKMLEKDNAGTLFKKASDFRGGPMWVAFDRELLKMGESPEAVSTDEARAALKRLRQLDKTKPTAEQLTRGAITGAMVGPAAALASRAVAGGDGLRKAMRSKTLGGKALGTAKALLGGTRNLGGAAASGAVFGAGLPTVRSQLDQRAEKQKLRDYLQMSNKGTAGRLRGRVTRAIGV